MSDLISIGKSGVLAYQGALATISDNVVNANNDGFAKREVSMSELHAVGGPMFLSAATTSFSGVAAATVTRVWDQYRAQRAWSASSDSSQASTKSQWASTIESGLDDGSSGVGVKLTAIFTNGNSLAANPNDTALRQSFLYAIDDAAGAISRTGSELSKISSNVASQASDAVTQINDALITLGRTNVSLQTVPQGSSGRASLEDQRDRLLGTIANRVGIDVSIDSHGAAVVRMNDNNGPYLLMAGKASPEQLALHVANDGQLSFTITTGATSLSISPTSGSLAGYADIASQLAGRSQQIDGLAASLAQQINAWNAQGTDLNGNPGGNLMSGTNAATLALASSDTNLVAAADATTPNGNLLTLKNLRTNAGVEESWRTLVTDQGLRVQSAQALASSATSAKDAALSDLDDLSGVDLDAQAADLMRFQQAYSASAKIIQTARETMQTILNLF